MKSLFTAINIFLITGMAYFCVEIMYKSLIPQSAELHDDRSSQSISKKIKPARSTQNVTKKQHNIIVQRNLFKVQIEKKIEPVKKQAPKEISPEDLEATKLKLVLLGTVTGGEDIYAVIEDKKVRQQALYQVGDTVQEAKLKKILRDKVVLFYQGKDQVLEMEVVDKKSKKAGPVPKELSPRSVPTKNQTAQGPPTNLSTMKKQIKFRPHFSEGQPDGMMVYGIRPNSVFRQIGLRNGDIIKDINGTPIVSSEDTSQLFSEIETQEDARLTLFRRGKVKELVYQVKDGRYSISAHPED
ncbi:MAG: type II secretion system protein GspC [Desulfobacteraceae bacterium]|nr:type II secretion system protein GspC [Desulfobacteraceae bacterium]